MHPSALSPADVFAWRAIQAQTADFADPLLGPDFAQAVGEHRQDAQVTVFRDGTTARGFFAFHRRPSGFGRPIGSPFSDYHAVVTAPGVVLSSKEVLAGAGLNAFSFDGLIDPNGGFSAETRDAYTIRLETSPADYLEGLRAASPKRFKNMRRLESKLEREVGPLRLVGDDQSRETFDTIIAWKRDQFRRTGKTDVLRSDWSRALMESLFARRTGDFRGLMIGLYAGDVLVGGHFGVRQGGHYHPWLASTHPDYAAYSPGQTFLTQAIAAMPSMGLDVYDLGPGHDHYKRPFSPNPISIGAGLATAASAGGRLANARDIAWTLAGASRTPAIGKLRRRLDHIAAAELSTGGRVRGFIEALASQGRTHAPDDGIS
ncbi:GNAT family N-acetyltransferase [soil metagenome]